MAKFFNFGLGDLRKAAYDKVTKGIEAPAGGIADTGDGRSVISDLRDRLGVSSHAVDNNYKVVKTPAFKITESKDSATAPFSSLFNNFKLQAVPYYNFFTEDEETNDTTELSGRKLQDIPRYVKLTWQPGPVTDKPPKNSVAPPSTKNIKSISFIVDERVQPLSKRGILFDKQAAEEFSVVKDAVANGFITPGVIRSIVELPLSKAGFKKPKLTPKIDEQLYLKSPMTDGISIHDLQANVNVRFNGMLGAADIGDQVMSNDLKRMKEDLFDGQFSVSKITSPKRSFYSSFTDPSSFVVRDVTPNSPSLTMNMNTVAGSSAGAGSNGTQESDPVDDAMFETVAEPAQPSQESDSTEVNFVDPAITGLIGKDKVNLISAPEHAEACAGLGQFLPNLCTMSELHSEIRRRTDIPSFPADKDNEGTKYVGYIIEKYIQGNDGVFQLLEEIPIPDGKCSEYIDTKVIYGGVYRYRIKGILRWVRKGNVNHKGFEEGNVLSDEFTQTSALVTHKSSYFATDWNRKWQYAAIIDIVEPNPPDEFVIRPESHRKRIVITWKVPHNPQRDLRYYRLFRKEQVGGKDISDWELVDVMMGAKNVMYIDNDVEFEQNGGSTYVYAAQSVTYHNEFSNLSCQRGARLNEQYRFSGEFPIVNIASEGVPLNAIGAFAYRPVRKYRTTNIAKDSLIFTTRIGFHREKFQNGTYCLRLESLDTGEIRDIIVKTEYNEQPPEVREIRNLVYSSMQQLDDPLIQNEMMITDQTDGPFTFDRSGADSDSTANANRSKASVGQVDTTKLKL